jgi:hypothetical protein
MKSKFSMVVILFVVTSLAFSTVAFAQGSNKDIPEDAGNIPTPNMNVPKMPEPLPNVPGINGNMAGSPVPQDTLKTLKTIENLNNIQKTLNTLKTIEALDKIQNVGTITVTLTNSDLYKELNVGVTALLDETDLDANVALFEKHLQIIKENIQAELAALTDKELGWEQESRNVLKSVRKKINTIAGKEFLADLFYSQFELKKKK